jgi:hypothetical protein
MSRSSFQLKGGGWYSEGYSSASDKKGTANKADAGAGDTSKAAAKTESTTPKAESKAKADAPAAKSEAKSEAKPKAAGKKD